MRFVLQLPLLLVAAAALAACGGGGAEEGGGGPACGDWLAKEASSRYDGEAEVECYLVARFNGVRVVLPSVDTHRGWVLEGAFDGEPFVCTVTPGMIEGDRCSEDPRIGWSSSVVRLAVHPCELSLRLVVDGEQVAGASVEPAYEWSEPNGAGCGWVGVAEVALSPDEA